MQVGTPPVTKQVGLSEGQQIHPLPQQQSPVAQLPPQPFPQPLSTPHNVPGGQLGVQIQAPLKHVSLVPHACPQLPQLLGSVFVFAHTELQHSSLGPSQQSPPQASLPEQHLRFPVSPRQPTALNPQQTLLQHTTLQQSVSVWQSAPPGPQHFPETQISVPVQAGPKPQTQVLLGPHVLSLASQSSSLQHS